MKKRWISWILAALMVLTLMPLSALAAPAANTAAFEQLKSFVMTNGKKSGGNYTYQCADEKMEDMDGTFSMTYLSSDNAVALGLEFKESGLTFRTEITVPANLNMPYAAQQTYSYGLLSWKLAADIDSAFSVNSALVLTENTSGVDGEDLEQMEQLFRYTLAVLLTDVQDLCFAGSRYSIADLGFTTLADEYLKPDGWKQAGSKWYYYENYIAATGWKKVNNVWYWFTDDGVMQTGWQKIGGVWYYFRSSGSMVVGWQKIDNVWYYFAPGGQMQTGWREINGTWYYLKPSGAMAAKEWCGGWWLNADGSWTYPYKGSWKKNNVGWWFGDESGWYACNTKVKINDVVYTFDARGYMK